MFHDSCGWCGAGTGKRCWRDWNQCSFCVPHFLISVFIITPVAGFVNSFFKKKQGLRPIFLLDFQNFLAQLAGLEYAANAHNVGFPQKPYCDVVGFVARAGDDGKGLPLGVDTDVSISDSACHSYSLLNTFPRTGQDRNGQSWSCPAVRTSPRPRQAQRSVCLPALCHCPCVPEQTGSQNRFFPISCPCCRQPALWWCSRLHRCQTLYCPPLFYCNHCSTLGAICQEVFSKITYLFSGQRL